MRKPSRREIVLLVLLALGVAVIGIRFFRRAPEQAAVGTKAGNETLPAIPRIGLARLDAPRGTGEAGRRNLFGFGVVPEEPRPTPPVVATPPPTPPPGAMAGGMGSDGTFTPSLPPLNLKYVAWVQNARGVKIAVFVTDRRETLTGQAGQVVANRYRIARIGLESVDIEDVNTGQSRRIPLRGE